MINDFLVLLNKSKARKNERILVTIEVINNSIEWENNLLFRFKEVSGLTYIKGSFKINNEFFCVEKLDFLELEGMNPNQKFTLSFEYLVEEGYREGFREIFISMSDGQEEVLKGVSIYLYKDLKVIKNITVQNQVCLPVYPHFLDEVTGIYGEAEIIKKYVTETLEGVSIEEEYSSGVKLLVKLMIKERIEYIINDENLSSKWFLFNSFTSTYITLPKNFKYNDKTEVLTQINDIYFRTLEENKVLVVCDIDIYLE